MASNDPVDNHQTDGDESVQCSKRLVLLSSNPRSRHLERCLVRRWPQNEIEPCISRLYDKCHCCSSMTIDNQISYNGMRKIFLAILNTRSQHTQTKVWPCLCSWTKSWLRVTRGSLIERVSVDCTFFRSANAHPSYSNENANTVSISKLTNNARQINIWCRSSVHVKRQTQQWMDLSIVSMAISISISLPEALLLDMQNARHVRSDANA